MPKRPRLSPECLEQLHTWVHINCPCALENEQFLPGLWAIVEDEVDQAVVNAKRECFQKLETPSSQ